MKVKELVEKFVNEKVKNTVAKPNAVDEFLEENINVRKYIPYADKKEIADIIIANNCYVKNGYKTVNSVDQFLSFITSMIISHTDLEIEDPYKDYDSLSETGLLQLIISKFEQDYKECDIMLKMALDDYMQDNNLVAVVANGVDALLNKVSDITQKAENIDVQKIIEKIDPEMIKKIGEMLNK